MRRTALLLLALCAAQLTSAAPADLRPSELAAPQPGFETNSTTASPTTTTDDIPDFNRNAVRLDVPGELFGSSVNLVNRGSKVVGDVIMNAAVRFQRFVQALSPLFGRKLGITATRTRRDPDGTLRYLR